MKNSKVLILLAVLLLIGAVGIHYLKYVPEKQEYELEQQNLNNSIMALRTTIAENEKYAEYQEMIDPALEELSASRTELYSHFPAELMEEDQILYMLYLEELLDIDITFSFAEAEAATLLSDRTIINTLTIVIDYETTYEGFQELIGYLATDSQITSIKTATMEYDEENDVATGQLELLRYTITTDTVEYIPPEVDSPDEQGKDNIFD